MCKMWKVFRLNWQHVCIILTPWIQRSWQWNISPYAASLVNTAAQMDFIFQSGMKLDISNNACWFKTNEQEQFRFLTETSYGQEPTQYCAFFSAVAPSSLPPAPDEAVSGLFCQAIQDIRLEQGGKMQVLSRTMQMSAPQSWVTQASFSTRSWWHKRFWSGKNHIMFPL